jgi:resuscitation-promoting factor RpfA
MTAELDSLVTGDALVRAVLVLAVLVLVRALLPVVLHGARRLPGRVGGAAADLGRALRPCLARRLVATVVGLGVPAVATLTELPAATAVAVDHRATGPVGRPVIAHQPTRQPATDAHRAASAETVVVRRDDTLWDVARRHLPRSASAAEIAAAWPRWYAANRAAIGPDPALLRPGMRLRSPDRRPAGTPATSHDRSPATRTDPGAVARSLDPDRR